MAHHPEPNDPWFPNQSTHLGLDWHTCGKELSIRNDVRYLLTDPSMVQVKDWAYRLDSDEPYIFMVVGVRAANDARLSGIQLLQFHSDCVLRSGNLWHSRYADL